MLVFIDTEFTSHAKPDLISVGLAAVGIKDFYAERTDYRHDDCSAFVLAEIWPANAVTKGPSETSPEGRALYSIDDVQQFFGLAQPFDVVIFALGPGVSTGIDQRERRYPSVGSESRTRPAQA